MRILKPHGLFYVSAPSSGLFHRYPMDCYRFYPDSGNALAKWSRLNGYRSIALEQFTCDQLADIWNDYVCVFLKDEGEAHRHPSCIIDRFDTFRHGPSHPSGKITEHGVRNGESELPRLADRQEDQDAHPTAATRPRHRALGTLPAASVAVESGLRCAALLRSHRSAISAIRCCN